jgi:hypothetical protein
MSARRTGSTNEIGLHIAWNSRKDVTDNFLQFRDYHVSEDSCSIEIDTVNILILSSYS